MCDLAKPAIGAKINTEKEIGAIRNDACKVSIPATLVK